MSFPDAQAFAISLAATLDGLDRYLPRRRRHPGARGFASSLALILRSIRIAPEVSTNLPRLLMIELRNVLESGTFVDEHIPVGATMKQKGNETSRGKETGEALLKKATREEERKTEARKGSDLAKGAKRFEERSQSSDGKSAGSKQR